MGAKRRPPVRGRLSFQPEGRQERFNYLVTAMAPPRMTMESSAYIILGTSFFLDVDCMIPRLPPNDIQLLAQFQQIV